MSSLLVERDGHVAIVYLNRPTAFNAMGQTFWDECRKVFEQLSNDGDVRCIVLAGKGKHFSAGLDLNDVSAPIFGGHQTDPARRAFAIRSHLRRMQNAFNSIEECVKPVIACIHGACIGGAIDMICAADIRICSENSSFSVKEVDIGLAADLGTLQRLPKVVGNASWVKEIAFSGRKFRSPEALHFGLVSAIYKDSSLMEKALKLAHEISLKSPIAVCGTKAIMNYSRDHSTLDGLEYTTTWNMAMLQTDDISDAIQANMKKSTPSFSKL